MLCERCKEQTAVVHIVTNPQDTRIKREEHYCEQCYKNLRERNDEEEAGAEVEAAIGRKGEDEWDVENMLMEFTESDIVYQGDEYPVKARSIDLASLVELARSKPIVKLLNLILLQAIKDGSSDIHFETYEDSIQVRYRVDGVLYEMMPPPKHLAQAIISRIKVMAHLT